jgi:hypothetical protein
MKGPDSRADSPLTWNAKYAYDKNTLQRWGNERMKIEIEDNGSFNAHFSFAGSTCSDLGHPLAFDFFVSLSPSTDGYKIIDSNCVPTEGDDGYKKMCSYIDKGDGHLALIQRERPELGRPLNDILEWEPTVIPAGCLCNRANRNHKWRIVLQTLHYQMVQHENES